jgi:osmotically inducible protein OsmC
MKRKGLAVWQGDLKSGNGTISTESGTLSSIQYSFSTRFEEGLGTNPEELIAAAHAGCFSMALSATLGAMNFVPSGISTSATVSLENLDQGWAITKVHLDVAAKVPACSREDFDAALSKAKETCPVSRLLNAEITVEARMEN